MDEVYDPRLDRLDVCVRGLVQFATQGKWKLLKPYGITLHDHFDPISAALLDLRTLKTEDGVLDLLAACPFLLLPALEMQSTYQYRAREGRLAYYKRTAT